MAGLVVIPGGGKAFDWHGARVVIKASGCDTVGQLAVMESTYPAGLSVPEHHHEGEDELFYLLDGELEGFCGEDRWTATQGSFVLVPRTNRTGLSYRAPPPLGHWSSWALPASISRWPPPAFPLANQE